MTDFIYNCIGLTCGWIVRVGILVLVLSTFLHVIQALETPLWLNCVAGLIIGALTAEYTKWLTR